MVNDTKQMLIFVNHKNRMYLVSVHDALYLRNLCRREDGLRIKSHNVIDGLVEEFLLPLLHSAADVSVSNQTDNTAVSLGYAKAQFSFADQDG